ncbi:MAG: hypothetical protein CO125_04110 [Hydrogenophilales bacterium CG_4_9_14_3_um_filter_59_35]|nr:MAG: hypothetical protein COW70_02405 [Hydrogenophilales bacterium CG18_big_fil_WC_8_21_14_2_50_58_12]PIY01569.1 MAG: hypothetical protein COZ23_02470 [Hydrogenophilales bacterium CG_4_10_14_3_um_filter_58_23]PJB07703.1 MAG: hypothetical protein CO125_04110 [Hydrogenophilales bacterium CG_4_9_14_3_um_filter_59_35]
MTHIDGQQAIASDTATATIKQENSTMDTATKSTSSTSSFDLNALRLPQNFGEALGVKRMITRVPVRKSTKSEFFRVRPGDEWRFQTMILEIKEERETYILTPDMWNAVPGLSRPAMLHTAIDRQNNVFLIPIPLPGEDGRRNPWHQSLAEVVAMAETKWVRSVANMAVGGYDMLVAEGKLAEPEWPSTTLAELVQIAFRDKLITSPDHPIIRQLLGVS